MNAEKRWLITNQTENAEKRVDSSQFQKYNTVNLKFSQTVFYYYNKRNIIFFEQ